MKAEIKTILSMLVLAGLLSACAAGGVYKQGNWSHSHADWDIDSVVCLQRSENLTPADYEKITEQRARREVITEQQKSIANQQEDTYSAAVSATIGFISSLSSVNAENSYQQGLFADCMKERGWGN